MKKLILIFFILLPLVIFSQVTEDSPLVATVESDPGPYSVEAQEVIDRMPHGISMNYKGAIDEFTDTLVFYDIWDSIDEIQVYAAGDIQSALVGWKGNFDAELSVAIDLQFHPGRGFTQRRNFPANDIGYINTTINPTLVTISTLNDRCFGFYNYDPTPTPTVSINATNGSQIASATSWYNPPTYVKPRIRINHSQNSGTYDGNLSSLHNKGFFVSNRNSNVDVQHYRNGALLFLRTNNTSTGQPDDSIRIYFNNAGFKGRVSMLFMSKSLIQSRLLKFYEAANRYVLAVAGFNGNGVYDILENNSIYTIIDTVFNNDYFYTVDVLDEKVLSVKTDTVMLSLDNGATYPHRGYFERWDEVEFGKIFSNGNILLSKLNGLYFSDDSLQTIVYDTLYHGKCRSGTLADSIYDYHTPASVRYPGGYFRALTQSEEQIINGNSIFVWGNYTNIFNGASPVNIYYTLNNGDSVKTAFEFGRSTLAWRDDGTPDGGATGTILGNPEIDSLYEHVHSVNYNPNDTSWYVCLDAGLASPESHAIIRGVYDFATDIWTWGYITIGPDVRLFNMYFEFGNDSVMCSSDLGSPNIFRVHIDDLNDPTKYREIYNGGGIDYVGTIIKDQNDAFLGSGLYTPYIHISLDNGDNWSRIDISDQIFSSYGRILPPDSEGYFRIRSQVERSWYVRDLKVKIK